MFKEYVKAQKKWVKESGIKLNDKVILVHGATASQLKDFPLGYRNQIAVLVVGKQMGALVRDMGEDMIQVISHLSRCRHIPLWYPYYADEQASEYLVVRRTILLFSEGCMSYESDQDKWIKEVGLRVGDKVLVVASAETHVNGWENAWTREMDADVGQVLRVEGLTQNDEPPSRGIQLEGGCGYPFFVLVKVEEKLGENNNE